MERTKVETTAELDMTVLLFLCKCKKNNLSFHSQFLLLLSSFVPQSIQCICLPLPLTLCQFSVFDRFKFLCKAVKYNVKVLPSL